MVTLDKSSQFCASRGCLVTSELLHGVWLRHAVRRHFVFNAFKTKKKRGQRSGQAFFESVRF